MNRRDLLAKTGILATASLLGISEIKAGASSIPASAPPDASADHDRWLKLAESLHPQLHETVQSPISIVRFVPDASRYLRWRMETISPAAEIEKQLFKRGDNIILDFGGHRTGYLSFTIHGEGINIDSPTRLRLTFGEIPSDVAEDFYPYNGELAASWLPDETINIDDLPQTVHFPRRHSFRFLKIEILGISPKYSARFTNIQVRAVTSAEHAVPDLDPQTPELLRSIDRVSLATLRDCMQTVFEDGPRRDQRLWIGDMRLQALTNYVSFRSNDLVKRCLYLFAAFPREDGLLAACIFDRPAPRRSGDYIMDYAVLYAAAVLDYARATNDLATAKDLWPVVRRQLELVGQNVNADGLFVDPKNMWIFIDWSTPLDRTASIHGVLLYCYRQAFELAKLIGAEREAAPYPEIISRMTKAARANFFDPAQKLFVSGPDRQVSWASQAWLTIAGVPTKTESVAAIGNAMRSPNAIRPVTPYLYHHVVDAMLTCGMKKEALDLLQSYWGGMVNAGADTFWEVYDPANSLLSPYGTVHINSYCHAWSCTPSYFLRSGLLAKPPA
jgi:alpha-L-rhamnosidase